LEIEGRLKNHLKEVHSAESEAERMWISIGGDAREEKLLVQWAVYEARNRISLHFQSLILA
jgi:hypothetical protein